MTKILYDCIKSVSQTWGVCIKRLKGAGVIVQKRGKWMLKKNKNK
jgi:hypothetical protein